MSTLTFVAQRVIVAVILIVSLLTNLFGQAVMSTQPPAKPLPEVTARAPSECSQPAAEQEPLIREAVENQYWIRRVAFLGIERARDDVLLRRLRLQEGDVFTREGLVSGLKRVSRLKVIYPVRLRDITIWLVRPERRVDILICFRERRPRHRTNRNPG